METKIEDFDVLVPNSSSSEGNSLVKGKDRGSLIVAKV
jgi:hypothetical protein